MSDLTEQDVIVQMKESLRQAGDACIGLANSPVKGQNYRRLREHLLLVEGCCRQISAMRDDSRWLGIGFFMAEAQKRSRKWLVGGKDPVTGVRFAVSMTVRHPLFDRLAQNLAFMLASVERLLTSATGVVGRPILPETPRYERPTGAPVPVSMPAGFEKSQGGILLPRGTVH
jgi:hypothetical protein